MSSKLEHGRGGLEPWTLEGGGWTTKSGDGAGGEGGGGGGQHPSALNKPKLHSASV